MSIPAGNPSIPKQLPAKPTERNNPVKPEEKSAAPAPAPAPAPAQAERNDNPPAITAGLDPRVAFFTDLGLKLKANARRNKGDDIEDPTGGGPADPKAEGAGSPAPAPPNPQTQGSINLRRLQGHLGNSSKELDALKTLTDPEKRPAGDSGEKTIFERLSGDDGHLTLEEAQAGVAKTDKDIAFFNQNNSNPLLPDAPEGALQKAETLNRALKVITTNGDFERLSGDKGFIDIDILNNEKNHQQEQVDNLTTLTTNGNFERIAGDDGRIYQLEAMHASYEGSEEFKKSAQWLSEDKNFALLANSSGKEDFDLTGKYKNIKIDEQSFTPDEVTRIYESMAFLDSDPDGRILLENTNKNKSGGFTIKKDATIVGAAAYVQGGNMVIGGSFASADKASNLRLLVHEMTHAATADGVPARGTAEAFANVLAARIGYRHSGAFDSTNYGHTFTFNGSTEDEAQVYKDTLLDTYKLGGAWSYDKLSYVGLPDFSYGDYLRTLGFKFDFPFAIELGEQQ